MATQGLKIDPPARGGDRPPRPEPPASRPERREARFDTVAEGDKVQFNKRVDRATGDGYKILAVRARSACRTKARPTISGVAPS